MSRSPSTTFFGWLIVMILMATPLPVVGQCEDVIISGGVADDLFGFELDASGDAIVVAASQDDQLGEDAGAAYIYRRTPGGWIQEFMLLASNGAAGDTFSSSVAIDGDLVAIGSPLADTGAVNAGAVYVYRFDGINWNEESILTAPVPAESDVFGVSVAIQGELIVVGATHETGAVVDSGVAHVFLHDGAGWILQDTLFASDGSASDLFGHKVAIDGNTIVVGAIGDDDNGLSSGSVYVFQFDGIGWTEQSKLLPVVGAVQQLFGASLAIDDGNLLVGSPGNNTAYPFRFDGLNWIELAALNDATDGSGVHFGYSVDLRNGFAVIGTRFGLRLDFHFVTAGAWPRIRRLSLVPFSALPIFTSVSIADAYVATGFSATGEVAMLATAGQNDCNNNGLNDICELETGLAFDCNFNGIPDICETDCNNNGIHDDCDLADGTSIDCNLDGIPDECVNDCNGNGIDDSCDIDASTSFDCNRNGVPDECDIIGSTSVDCDANGVPDECETDCNENGIGDACDLVDGTSFDLNFNGLPDECERANCPAEFKVIASDGNPGDGFGESVAIDGDVAVIGSLGFNDMGERSGSAYIFRRSGDIWIEEATLNASDGAGGDWFGASVAIHGDLVVVGAFYHGTEAQRPGQAYVYRYQPASSTWIEEAILQPSDPWPTGTTLFGFHTAIENDVIAIRSGRPTPDGQQSVVAYVFRHDPVSSTWIEESILLQSSIPYPYIWLPTNGLSISNGVLVGGEPGYFGINDIILPGKVFVHRYDVFSSTWIAEGTLNASDPDPADIFGIATAIHNDVIVVGASNNDDLGEDSGSAYVFRYDPASGIWSEETKLLASDGRAGDHYGVSVAVEDGLILIGADDHAHLGVQSGSVYRYQFDPLTNSWVELEKISPSFGEDGDEFGRDIALTGSVGLISARSDSNVVTDSGAAYFIEDTSQFCPGLGDINADGLVNVVDLLAILIAWGDCLPAESSCPADLDHNGVVNTSDLLTLLLNWG